MYYEHIRKGCFLARPNRFIAHVSLDGETVICHVKNTGRCKELLIPGATVYVQECDNPTRKTKFDLIAVKKTPAVGCPAEGASRLINMDAQAPNKVFGEWLTAGGMGFVPSFIKPETTYGKSRFDFYWEDGARRGFVEVKGVTLEVGGAVYFPDAPTERGVKHLEELIVCKAAGYEVGVCFVIQMSDVSAFSPNDGTHPAFGDALRRAATAGVTILAYDCAVTPNSLTMGAPVPVTL